MKKYLIMAATLIVSAITANGQTYSEKTITGKAKITKQQSPQTVINALNAKFRMVNLSGIIKFQKHRRHFTKNQNYSNSEEYYEVVAEKRSSKKR